MEDEELQDGEVAEQDLETLQLGGPGMPRKKGNILTVWGNEKTMNLNSMVLTNIMQSPYYKVQLAEYKTYHEVVDQIYYNVNHLEPWERGSRKTSGQIGMCGGVRGVGAGGIVSSAFCLLYKLFTLKLTRKQLTALINHSDSPFLRGLGFMYVRYCQPPTDLWEWYEPYLEDTEEIDPKAGQGEPMTVGQMVRHFLTRLDWYGTLFPRIPVPVQKTIDQKLTERRQKLQNERFPPQQDNGRREVAKRKESPAAERETVGKYATLEKDHRRRSRSPIRRPTTRRPSRSPARESIRARVDDIPRRPVRRSPTPERANRRRKSLSPPRRDSKKRDESSRKEKDNDLAALIEREKVRQRRDVEKEKSEPDRSVNKAQSAKRVHRSKSKSKSVTRNRSSSDSSGTAQRKSKEELQRKHKHKKHKSSKHKEERYGKEKERHSKESPERKSDKVKDRSKSPSRIRAAKGK